MIEMLQREGKGERKKEGRWKEEKEGGRETTAEGLILITQQFPEQEEGVACGERIQ